VDIVKCQSETFSLMGRTVCSQMKFLLALKFLSLTRYVYFVAFSELPSVHCSYVNAAVKHYLEI